MSDPASPLTTGESGAAPHPQYRYDELLRATQEEFPGFEVCFKDDSLLHKAIHYFLAVITFGGQREYLTRYHTMIGRRMWVPTREHWDSKTDRDRYALILHEREHMRQERRTGRVLHTFLYIFALPFGWNPYRRKCEQEGYEKTLWAVHAFKGEDALRDAELHDYIAKQFYTGAYGWMWTKRKTYAWLHDAVERVVSGEITNA